MELPHTRAMLTAALNGDLDAVDFEAHPVFGVAVPKACPGVPAEKLDARGMWEDPAAYDAAAADLAGRFQKNFEQFNSVPAEIRGAGPTA